VLPTGFAIPLNIVLVAPHTKFAVSVTAVIVGVLMFCVMFTVAGVGSTHPLPVFVTVNEYTPGAFTCTVLLFGLPTMPGPLQVYVTPLPGAPFKVTCGLKQFNTGVLLITAFGCAVFTGKEIT
jgi:hypothetical protein